MTSYNLDGLILSDKQVPDYRNRFQRVFWGDYRGRRWRLRRIWHEYFGHRWYSRNHLFAGVVLTIQVCCCDIIWAWELHKAEAAPEQKS